MISPDSFDKQVYELTADDLVRFSVWSFPMDESVEDELTVRPVAELPLPDDAQVIVSTDFLTADGVRYTGYLYWDGNHAVEHLKPVILMPGQGAVSFWYGLCQPCWQDYPLAIQALRGQLPIAYASLGLPGLPAISGSLEGLYHLDQDRVTCVA